MGRVEEKKRSSLWTLMIRSFLLRGCGSSEKDLAPKKKKKKIVMPIESRLSFKDLDEFDTPEDLSISIVVSNLHIFTLQDLKLATNNFSKRKLIGEGGFGAVYKGHVDEKLCSTLEPQDVAIKLLDLTGCQGHKEWLTEVVFLGQLKHDRLVKLIGYCYENQHRMLVYEYMPGGSLEDHLFLNDYSILGWRKRMKIVVEAAKGLQFLHGIDQPVIYRDFKASNILLDSDYNAKLSDFGLAKDGPLGDETHVSTRVMGTQGYAAPEYVMTGHLTTKSDVFCFGVVLLELLTGMRSFDSSRRGKKKNLVNWVKPYLEDPSTFGRLIDPRLQGKYSIKAVETVVKLTCLCLSYNPKDRPQMSTVVDTLEPIKDLDIDETMLEPKDNNTIVYHTHHKNLPKLQKPSLKARSDITLPRKIWICKTP